MTNDLLSDPLNVRTTQGITLDTPASVFISDQVRSVVITNVSKKEITVAFRPGKELSYAWNYRDLCWSSTGQLFGPTVLFLGPCPLKK